MTDSEVSKHPMENKLAVMEEYRNSATKNYFHHTSTPIMKESWAMRGDHESNLMGWEASTSQVGVGKEALEHETDIIIDVIVAS